MDTSTIFDRPSGKSFTIQKSLTNTQLADVDLQKNSVLSSQISPKINSGKSVELINLRKNAKQYRVFVNHRNSTYPIFTKIEGDFHNSSIQNKISCINQSLQITSSESEGISATTVQAVANLFLSDHLPDRFTADQPRFPVGGKSEKFWEVPVILTFPKIGNLGQVGRILVSVDTEKILSYTPIAAMKQEGQKLYEINRDAIQAHFL